MESSHRIGYLSSIGLALVGIVYVLVVVFGIAEAGLDDPIVDPILAVELGNITSMLKKIKPAVNSFSGYEREKASSNAEFVHMVAEKNVKINAERIRQEIPVLREMEATGEVKILGAMYDMETGQVIFMEL